MFSRLSRAMLIFLGVFFLAGSATAQPSEVRELEPSREYRRDAFGYRVAIDGDTAVVSAPLLHRSSGGAFVFERDENNKWIETTELPMPFGGWLAGLDCAISNDTIVIGVPHGLVGDVRSGVAFVYRKVDGTWTLVATLAPPNPQESDAFGASLDIDGDVIVVTNLPERGRDRLPAFVYVFRSDNADKWKTETILNFGTVSDYRRWGFPILLSKNRFVVGDPSANGGMGSALVFERERNGWRQTAHLTDPDGEPHDAFGHAVAIGDDVIAVGAPNDDGKGSVTIFEPTKRGKWVPSQKLTQVITYGEDRFGESLALDGDTLLIGVPSEDLGWRIVTAGVVYVVIRDQPDHWAVHEIVFSPEPTTNARFGHAVAIDGETGVISSFNMNASDGVAYVLDIGGNSPD